MTASREWDRFSADDPIPVQFDMMPDGNWCVRGDGPEHVKKVTLAMRARYGVDIDHGIIPKELVTTVDGDGNPTEDPTKIKSFRFAGGRETPVKRKSEVGHGAVKQYLYALERLLEGSSRDGVRAFAGDADRGVQMSRLLWAQMRNARIFEIPFETWDAFHRTTLDELQRSMGGLPEWDGEDAADVERAFNLEGRDQPFPQLPFSHTYLGIEDGVLLPPKAARLRIDSSQWHRLESVMVLGYLLVDGEKPTVHELSFVRMKDGDTFLMPIELYRLGSWDYAITLTPWVLNNIIDLLNSHRVVVEQGKPNLNLRRAFKKQSKATREPKLPPPYYTIRMQDVYQEGGDGSRVGQGVGRTLTYRHDREAHDRILVHRGPLPISPEDRERLEGRGYKVVTGRLSADEMEAVAKRKRTPKRLDEWVALKVVPIPERVIGPSHLPYVPAVRVPARGKAQKQIKKHQIPSILDPEGDSAY